MQHLGAAHKSPGQYSTDAPVVHGSQPHRYYLCRSLWKCFYLNWVWHLRRVFSNGPWHYRKWLCPGPFLSLSFFLNLAFQFAVVAVWFGEKKQQLCTKPLGRAGLLLWESGASPSSARRHADPSESVKYSGVSAGTQKAVIDWPWHFL